MCAKHIVAAGLDKVVFLEPYPKSLASDLHSDSTEIEGGDRGHYKDYPAVKFEHFYGVSPRRYREIFERAGRKNEADGSFVEYVNGRPGPTIDIKYPFYNKLEEFVTQRVMVELCKVVDETELSEV